MLNECSVCDTQVEDLEYVEQDGDIYCEVCHGDRYCYCETCETYIPRDDTSDDEMDGYNSRICDPCRNDRNNKRRGETYEHSK